MAGPGGIGLRDINFQSGVGSETSVIKQWLSLNSKYYGVDGIVWQPDQYVAQANWWRVIQEWPLGTLDLDVYTSTGLFEGAGAVEKDGTTITSITTVSTITEDPTNTSTWQASAFVDASYEADIVMASGVSYTYGRESRAQYNESLAGILGPTSFAQFQHAVNPYWPNGTLLFGVDAGPLPPVGSADTRVMPMSYRLCVTNDKNNQVPWPQPDNYNPDDFEILRRYATSLGSPSVGDLVSELNYNGYPSNANRSMRYDLCESGGSAVSTDEPTSIYGDYILGNRTERKAVAAKVKYWVAGMMYTLANDPQVPAATRASTSAWGLCKDAWPENGNWPELVYFREGIRIMGDEVSTQNTLVRGECRSDSVALGSWTIDVHIMNRIVGTIGGTVSAYNEGQIGFAPLPGNGSAYEMPYSILLPRRSEATNLLVPNTPSASHIAFASIRVEPTFMQLGTAAGAAAALVAQMGVAAQDVPVRQLQGRIVQAGQCIHWPDCSNVTLC